jgi:hypothetical protein
MHSSDRPQRKNLLDVLPVDLAVRAADEVREREDVIWVGQPRPDLYARGANSRVVFGIIFLAFALPPLGGLLFSLGSVTSRQEFTAGVFCLPLISIAAILFGIHLVTAPARLRRLARNTCYILTDRRALTLQVSPNGQRTVRSYPPDILEGMTCVEQPDGSGSLMFESVRFRRSHAGGGLTHSRNTRIVTHRYGFLAIDDVARVEHLIRYHLRLRS